jgi:hypothetical protein
MRYKQRSNINGMELTPNPIDDADDYIILEGTITNPTSASGPSMVSMRFSLELRSLITPVFDPKRSDCYGSQ